MKKTIVYIVVSLLSLSGCDSSNSADDSEELYCLKNGKTYSSQLEYNTLCVSPATPPTYTTSSSSQGTYVPTYYSSSSDVSSSSVRSSSSVTVYRKTCGDYTYVTTSQKCYGYAYCTNYTVSQTAACSGVNTATCNKKYEFNVGIAGCTNSWTKQ